MPDSDGSLNRTKTQLRQEFREVKFRPRSSLSSFDAVIVLSAEETDISGENRERFLAGLKLIKKVGANSSFIFLGTKVHNASAEVYMREKHPEIKMKLPTKRKEASTRTQIKDLATFLGKKPLRKPLIVSQAYHLPRIDRYCQYYMPEQVYDVYPVGNIDSCAGQVEIEIDKIIKYAGQGDLNLWLKN